jgi:hypothetical protein
LITVDFILFVVGSCFRFAREPMFRWLLITLIVSVGGAGCARSVPPNAAGAKIEQARKQAETLAANVVGGMANAQAKLQAKLPAGLRLPNINDYNMIAKLIAAGASGATVEVAVRPTPSPQPPIPPAKTTRPTLRADFPPVIKEHVASSLPYTTAAEAEEDALVVAQDTIERRLAELDPPVKYRPSVNELKDEFLLQNSRTVRAPNPEQLAELEAHGLSTNRVYVEYDIEVSARKVRELRTLDRLGDGLRVLGGLTAIALVGFLFLRLDELTRGNLTRWLAIGAALLVGAAAAALYYV